MRSWQRAIRRGETGTPYQATSREERSTGIIPQLLNPIDSDELPSFLSNWSFVVQEKFDGRRTLIRLANGAVEGINRTGLVVALPEPIASAVKASNADSIILDGELLGEVFVAFDILEVDGKNIRECSYELRLTLLSGISNLFGVDVRLVETAVTTPDKRSLCDRLLKEGKEGIVFKDLGAPYSSGRPASASASSTKRPVL